MKFVSVTELTAVASKVLSFYSQGFLRTLQRWKWDAVVNKYTALLQLNSTLNFKQKNKTNKSSFMQSVISLPPTLLFPNIVIRQHNTSYLLQPNSHCLSCPKSELSLNLDIRSEMQGIVSWGFNEWLQPLFMSGHVMFYKTIQSSFMQCVMWLPPILFFQRSWYVSTTVLTKIQLRFSTYIYYYKSFDILTK